MTGQDIWTFIWVLQRFKNIAYPSPIHICTGSSFYTLFFPTVLPTRQFGSFRHTTHLVSQLHFVLYYLPWFFLRYLPELYPRYLYLITFILIAICVHCIPPSSSSLLRWTTVPVTNSVVVLVPYLLFSHAHTIRLLLHTLRAFALPYSSPS